MSDCPSVFLDTSKAPIPIHHTKGLPNRQVKVAWIFGIVTQKRVKAREEYLFYASIIKK